IPSPCGLGGRIDGPAGNTVTSKQYVATSQGVAKKPKKSSCRWATLDFGTTKEFRGERARLRAERAGRVTSAVHGVRRDSGGLRVVIRQDGSERLAWGGRFVGSSGRARASLHTGAGQGVVGD